MIKHDKLAPLVTVLNRKVELVLVAASLDPDYDDLNKHTQCVFGEKITLCKKSYKIHGIHDRYRGTKIKALNIYCDSERV